MTLSLHASPDGQWCAVRRGKQTAWYVLGPTAGVDPLEEPQVRVELPEPASDLLVIGPPTQAITVTRSGDSTSLELLSAPKLERIAALSIAGRWSGVAVTGSRAALLAEDARTCTIIRAAAKSLVAQHLDPGAGLIDLLLGMERQQLAIGTTKRLEVWDAVSARPLTRLQVQLPPPPRTIGTAAGHWWILRAEQQQILLMRLSDGRPFLHNLGAPIRSVVSHPASPWLVVVTSRGLVRLSCFAHAMAELEAPAAEAYAIAPSGDEAVLLGASGFAQAPWVMRLSASAAAAGVPRVTTGVVVTTSPMGSAPIAVAVAGKPEPRYSPPPAGATTERLREMRERAEGEAGGQAEEDATTDASAETAAGAAGLSGERTAQDASGERTFEDLSGERRAQDASGERTAELLPAPARRSTLSDDTDEPGAADGAQRVGGDAGATARRSTLGDDLDVSGDDVPEAFTAAERSVATKSDGSHPAPPTAGGRVGDETASTARDGGGAAAEAATASQAAPSEERSGPQAAEAAPKPALPSWALNRRAPGAAPAARATARPGAWPPTAARQAPAASAAAAPPAAPDARASVASGEPPTSASSTSSASPTSPTSVGPASAAARPAAPRPGAPSWFAGAAARAQRAAQGAAARPAAPVPAGGAATATAPSISSGTAAATGSRISSGTATASGSSISSGAATASGSSGAASAAPPPVSSAAPAARPAPPAPPSAVPASEPSSTSAPSPGPAHGSLVGASPIPSEARDANGPEASPSPLLVPGPASMGSAPRPSPLGHAVGSPGSSTSGGGAPAASTSASTTSEASQPAWYDATTPVERPAVPASSPPRPSFPSFGPAEHLVASGGPRPVPEWASSGPAPKAASPASPSGTGPIPKASSTASSNAVTSIASSPLAPRPSPIAPAAPPTSRPPPIAPGSPSGPSPVTSAAHTAARIAAAHGGVRSWRGELAIYGAQAIAGIPGTPPEVHGNELSILARRLSLPEEARIASTILYSAWLAGQPFLPIAQLAALLGEGGWQEALGTGALGQLGLLRHRDGAVALRRSVADALDGRPWGAIRVAGDADAVPLPLPGRLGRIGVSAWPAWQAYLGKVALVTGKLRRALVEARLAELVAVTFDPLSEYPSPWPTGTNLLVVTDAIGGLTELLPELHSPPG